MLAAGFSHTCALRTRGELLCWGNNSNGQLGNGTTFRRLAPTPIAGPNNDVIGISAGLLHTCAVASSGSIRCWGFNGARQLGDTTTQDRTVPTEVALDPFRRHFTGVAAGEVHTCGLTVFHSVVCWGDNSQGQLGRGRFTPPSDPGTVLLGSNIGATDVAAGEAHSCALRTNGRISCWGNNDSGQLGLGTVGGIEASPVLIPPDGIPQALDVTASGGHTCALLIPGRVRCWGFNVSGQIGDGTFSKLRPSPVEVNDLTNVAAVTAGIAHTCALTADGQVFCWSSDLDEALGNGPGLANSASPVQVTGITDAIQIDAGGNSTCALLADGTAQCWGAFVVDGEVVLPVPSPTTMFDRVVAVSGYWCGLDSDGTILCRGHNSDGQLGDGATFTSRSAPSLVADIADGGLVDAGVRRHTCAIRTSGRANCWGNDFFGRLGDGAAEPPFAVPLPREVVRDDGNPPPLPALTLLFAISAGSFHSCALQTSGAPFCWGENFESQLGDGSTVDLRDAATEVPSFRFNLAPDGALRQGGKRAALAVLANCQDQAQARIEVTVRQGAVVGEGHATVQCTGQLESYPVEVRAEDKGPFTPGVAQAEAVITVRSQGQVAEVLRWNRSVELSPE